MAEEHAKKSSTESESSNGHNIGRAAVIAAASGATAYAAKKAFSNRSSTEDEGDKSNAKGGDGGSAALVTAAVASGWDVAKDSLMPVVEDAAAKAGAFVAERAPDIVRDVVVPRFIAGFEGGRGKNQKSEKSDD
jgi:hypothetical protein